MTYEVWRRLLGSVSMDLHNTRQKIAYWKGWHHGYPNGPSRELADAFVAFYLSRWAYHMNELRQLRCLSDLS